MNPTKSGPPGSRWYDTQAWCAADGTPGATARALVQPGVPRAWIVLLISLPAWGLLLGLASGSRSGPGNGEEGAGRANETDALNTTTTLAVTTMPPTTTATAPPTTAHPPPPSAIPGLTVNDVDLNMARFGGVGYEISVQPGLLSVLTIGTEPPSSR
jgi:hypothetical protein